MSLNFVQTSPAVMLGTVTGILGYTTFVSEGEISWKIPAFGSAAFWIFSAFTIFEEGLLAVIENHNQNFWGNQVWFDLLYSVGLFWLNMLPRAKKLGMPIVPWFIYVCVTASIGGLHMYARILYLEGKEAEKSKNG